MHSLVRHTWIIAVRESVCVRERETECVYVDCIFGGGEGRRG